MKLVVNIFSFLLIFSLYSCNTKKEQGESKRIAYVNSYHSGYGSSDDVMAGITEALAGIDVEMKTFFMDTKRRSDEAEIRTKAQLIRSEIDAYSPDILIVSDDNAVKYLVQPYFNNTKTPVVFCGVNWSAEQYGLGKNVTGMLEVLPLRELLSEIKQNYPDAKKLVVLSENSLSEQNNKTILDTLYRNMGFEVTYSLANDFETWKTMFETANETADLIYMPTNGAIKNWNNREAELLVEDLKIPAVTCDDFMMSYVVYGLTKVAKEQGEWAAQTALKILNGKKPSEIPYTKNSQTKAWLNTGLADKINFKISEDSKQHCTKL